MCNIRMGILMTIFGTSNAMGLSKIYSIYSSELENFVNNTQFIYKMNRKDETNLDVKHFLECKYFLTRSPQGFIPLG